MIPPNPNHDTSEGEQWGHYHFPRYTLYIYKICIYMYNYMHIIVILHIFRYVLYSNHFNSFNIWIRLTIMETSLNSMFSYGYESKPWHPRYPKVAGSGWLFPNMIDMIVGFDPSRQIMSHKPLVIKRPSLNLAPCWEKSSRTIRDGHQYIIIS